MNISAAIFRTYDIRGVVTEDLRPEVVREIGRAFGSACEARGQRRVVIGRDGRLSSPELAEHLAEGLQATGREVIDIGLAPTPVLYYATFHFDTGTGVQITGSHNPPDYNGLKMMIGGDTLHSETITELYQRIERGDFVAGSGSYRSEPVTEDYIRRVAGDIRLERALRVAVDCGNGAAGAVAEPLLRSLGLEPVALFCEVDGRFPNHHPDPSKEENLVDLQRVVAEQGLDVGLAIDGDGDRLGVIDGDGNVIWPDRQMMLFSQDILARRPGARIIFDVKCSKFLQDVIAEAGGEPIMSKTGHSLLKARLKETGADLAGEMSGHIFFKERWYGFDDALYVACRLLEILAKDPRPPTQVFADLPNSVNTPELNVHFAEGQHYAFIERFQREARFEGAQIIDIDGVRAEWPDGWGLARASNTTPSLVLRFEAETREGLERIQEQFREQMLAVDPDLQLPF